MKVDFQQLLSDLRRDEGLRLKPYQCTAGAWTIGYGRNLSARGWTKENIESLGSISETLAEKWLEDDADEAVDIARQYCAGFWNQLNEPRQRALSNMAFCLGRRIHQFLRLRRRLFEKEWDAAAHEITGSLFAKQVGDRAKRIAALIKDGADTNEDLGNTA
jgi:lysozyme